MRNRYQIIHVTFVAAMVFAAARIYLGGAWQLARAADNSNTAEPNSNTTSAAEIISPVITDTVNDARPIVLRPANASEHAVTLRLDACAGTLTGKETEPGHLAIVQH